ncbi:hypothetical protein ACJRO7_004644 [Eucalyptus globulus]|uniref:Methenyltetrahydrofolate cyclohydrolase n=1 Tax=Eucalyptus globulus TaxID=34317 RepID=A0ABD3IXT7_EUCGL
MVHVTTERLAHEFTDIPPSVCITCISRSVRKLKKQVPLPSFSFFGEQKRIERRSRLSLIIFLLEAANGQTANVINGKSIARAIRAGIANEICRMKETIVKSPGLAIVLVGGRRDSRTFIRVKLKACEEVGITTYVEEFPEECTEDEVLRVVSRLNNNPSVNGIIVQLPLPQNHQFCEPRERRGWLPSLNMGNLAMKGREPLFIPCAPKSCIELLLRSGVEIMGKRAVVVGRSKIVGLPTSLLLQRHHATVSTVHSFTKNPEQITREADIVIADVGIPNLIRGSWLKPGAVVVDMGTNQVQVGILKVQHQRHSQTVWPHLNANLDCNVR